MRPRALLLVFALALPVLLLATLPLRLALELAGPERLRLQARAATGSLWNGRLHDASLGGVALGDAAARLAPLPLLAGARAINVATPTLSGRLLLGRRSGLDRVNGSLALPSTPLPGTQMRLRGEDLQVLFSNDACHSAGGRLTVALERTDGTGLAALHGRPSCQGRTAVLPLAAVDATGPLARMHATARLHPDGQWELEVRIPVLEDPAQRRAVETMGFQPGPGGWSRIDRGRLSGGE